LKDLAPSSELRQWFAHDPDKWQQFQRRYFAELDRQPQALHPLLLLASRQRLTFIFGARDEQHNNAVALRAYLIAHSSASPR
jgi:uncharacterized protein YeaO (DUF488 family)